MGAISAAILFCAPANANVIYNLSFDNVAGSAVEGTGVLTLTLPNISDAYGLNSSDPSIFSLVTSDINGLGSFNLSKSNVSSFFISTSNTLDSPAGHIYSLTVAETIPPNNDASGILILNLFTGDWQIHGLNNATIDGGKLFATGPFWAQSDNDATTPLPAALPLFASGAGVLGYLGWRRKKKHMAAVAPDQNI